MPYQYRTLSPEAQRAIVRRRHERGYPLHAPPHPFREAGSSLITAAHFEHKPVMEAPERRDEFEARLLNGLRFINIEVSGWVILPNRYQVLVMTDSVDSISVFLKSLHGVTAREWNLAD